MSTGTYNRAHLVGENHNHWKGGKPKCVDCKTQLNRYSSVRCKPCAYRLNVGKKRPNSFIEKIKKALTGRKLSVAHKKKLSQVHLGQIPGNKGKRMLKISGKKHWNWKGGLTSRNKKDRESLESKLWREAVFKRDNYTCQKTGVRGETLHPHHILNFAQYPKLRFAIDNGITLSKSSHQQFHRKYGRKNNTRKQLNEFLAQSL